MTIPLTSRVRGAALLALFLAPGAVPAHPMGNMGISHYSELLVQSDRILLRHVLDFAEIPAFQETQKHRIAATDGGDAPPPYLHDLATQLTRGLSLRIGALAARWTPVRPCSGKFSRGAAGMHTLRIDCEFSTPLPAGMPAYELVFRDGNHAQRSGWKEVVLHAQAPMQVVSSSVPSRGRSAALTEYPPRDLDAPPQVTEARATVRQETRTGTR